jgi:hypothetical protein
MLINGRDLATDGFTLIQLTGWSSPPAWQRSTAALPNIHGVVPALWTSVEPRQITVGVRYYCTTLAARQGALLTLQDRLTGLLTLRFDDWTDRVVRGVASAIRVTSMDPGGAFAIPGIEMAFTITAYDGASYDAEPRVLALTTTPTAVALGTLPSAGLIRLDGAWTSSTARTVTFRAASGVSQGTLTLTAPSTASLAAGDGLEIDLGRQYVTKVTAAGVRTNAYAWKTAGAWFALDPAYADRAATQYATLEVSTGTGSLLYRPAYAL